MRRDVMLVLAGLATASAMAGCERYPETRARRIAEHEQNTQAARASETVQRLHTPQDSGRIIYDQPTDLSLENARRTGATINGIEKTPQPAFDSASIGARSPGGAKP